MAKPTIEAKALVLAAARTANLDIPDDWATEAQPDQVAVAAFTLETAFTVDGDYVERTGKVFELGNHPDWGFSLNEAEADASVAAFKPVNNDLEHLSIPGKVTAGGVKTILDGKLGDLRDLKRIGNELHAKVRIPKWLHEAHGVDKPLKVSLVFNRAKQVVSNALTWNPGIPDAQLVAAFTAFTAAAPDDVTPPATARLQRKEIQPMSKFQTWLDEVMTAFAKAPQVTDDQLTDPKDAEIARLKADLAAKSTTTFTAVDETARIATEVDRIATEYVRQGKVSPVGKPAVVAAFTAAVENDKAMRVTAFTTTPVAGVNPTTCFSADGQLISTGPMTAAVKSIYDGLPVNPLFKDLVPGETYTAIPTGAGPADKTVAFTASAERERLLSLTYQGQQVLKETK